MFEGFTERARKVMSLARQEAQRLNHEYISTEHILIGLIQEGSGVAANVLKNILKYEDKGQKMIMSNITIDIDLLRKIMMALTVDSRFNSSFLPNFDANIVNYHIDFLVQKNYCTVGCKTFVQSNGSTASVIHYEITPNYSDLISYFRQEEIWESCKTSLLSNNLPLTLLGMEIALKKYIEKVLA